MGPHIIIFNCALEAPGMVGVTASLSPTTDAQEDSMGATPGLAAAQPLQQTSLSPLNSPAENLLELLFGVFFEGK